ncbi:MAG: helix-turn-helix domain-containing protein [Bacteroidia bacterium]
MLIIQLSSEELENMMEKAVSKALSSQNIGNTEPNFSLLTIEQAAEFLNLAKPTLYSFTSKREIPHLKKGKRIYFEKEKLVAWLNEGRQKTQSEIASEMGTLISKKGGRNGK